MTQNVGDSKLSWLKSVVVAVLIALIAGTTSPWWWSEIKALIVNANKPSQSAEVVPKPPPSQGKQTRTTKNTSLSVIITAPRNAPEVDVHDFIEGKVSDKDAHVWLVIQPLETMACWVQKPVIVDDTGTWKASVQFGEYTADHRGKRYEVRALVNPHSALVSGPIECWPQAEATSTPLFVKRR